MNTPQNIKLTEIEEIISKNPFHKKTNVKMTMLCKSKENEMMKKQQIPLSSIKLRNVELLRK
ncbi:hypothetical protein CN398_09735 [Bacillus thuringiensis]|uniref:Uncharacterized protein n=1 Tax=Bacillus thuringiensis TaxID=1428 RepID=A0A9X6VCL2_BACTU|nr:hypothetical protein CN398_09735 [Bacillus thuringiensis]